MGSENFSQKPESIKEAINAGNKEQLSMAGRKGARVAARNREIRKDEKKEIDKQYTIEHTYREILHKDGEEVAETYLKSVEKIIE